MTADDKTGQDNAAEVIGHLYEVAVDPLRYEALLDRWEAVIGPRRRAAKRAGRAAGRSRPAAWPF